MVIYSHTNIVAKDWRLLAKFYQDVFECEPLLPHRNLHGKEISEGTGVKNAALSGIHLRLPGFGTKGPTLEIFEYENGLPDTDSYANRKGLRHLAFSVQPLEKFYLKAIACGAKKLGELVEKEIPHVGIVKFIYIYDPEYNIIELQEWIQND